MANQEKDFTYYPLKKYLEKKGTDYIPTKAIELAHLAARAAASLDYKSMNMYSIASVDSMVKYAKDNGYTLELTTEDVLPMAVCSTGKSKDSKGEWTVTPEQRFLERMVFFGRAKKIPAPKAKATKAPAKPKAKAPVEAPASDNARLDSMEATLKAIVEALGIKG